MNPVKSNSEAKKEDWQHTKALGESLRETVGKQSNACPVH
jgi:hypothetical protein